MVNLKTIDWKIYNYLKDRFKEDPTKWISKEEILEDNPTLLKEGAATSHDICSSLNLIRIRLNKACNEGQISHLILLHKSKFKIAASAKEAQEYLKRDLDIGIKHIVRYYENMNVLKRNGQGKLIDCKGNVIDDDSLAKRFIDVFNVS